MGSRGNSGTIMSQIWRGFADSLGDVETFDLRLAVSALRAASNKAYTGVQSPVEGTILTIIREIAEEAEVVQENTTNLVTLLERIVTRGWDAVQRTPDMLPVLKDAGGVDSGGTGLVYVLEGMLKYLRGEAIEVPVSGGIEAAASMEDHPEADLLALSQEKYNYDVQFVLHGENLQVEKIKHDIEAMGDSGVIIGDRSAVKVHIHVDFPSVPIAYGEKLGWLGDVVIENMQAQYEALLAKQKARQEGDQIKLREVKPGEIAVIAVAAGKGLAKVFGELGVAGIIDGGQTNNPSTEEILSAARQLNTDQVIVLPNNKNIIMAANQATENSEDIKMIVVPTVSIPQGIAAMLAYHTDGELEEVAEEMQDSRSDVITGEITTATRTVEIEGVAVQEGQVIGIVDGKLRVAGDKIETVIQRLLESIDLEDYELVTLYYGDDVDLVSVNRIAGMLREQFEDVAFETVSGGQPHYHYILGIE